MKTKYIVLVFILFSALGSASRILAQDSKQIAIIETRDPEEKFHYGIKLLLRGLLTDIIAATPGYEAFDRVDMSSVMSEQEFQRNGLVDENDIRELGKLTGSDFVLLTDIGYVDDTHMTLASKLIDVETGKITNSAHLLTSIEHNELEKNCKNIALKLLNLKSDGSALNTSSNPGSSNQKGQDYIETALGLNMKMVYVEGGDFLMGEFPDANIDPVWLNNGVRETTLSSYYIGECEITWEQWTKVMGTTIWDMANKNNIFDDDRDVALYFSSYDNAHPMTCITWTDAMAFCEKLSRITGKKYSLPTEAQWEYAAKGGNKSEGTLYSGSNNIDEVAWWVGNKFYPGNGNNKIQVGKKRRPNKLGLYDMSGNVDEWCYDWYQEPYDPTDTKDPKGPSFGENHVVRGGSYNGGVLTSFSVSARYFNKKKETHYTGFRVVMIP